MKVVVIATGRNIMTSKNNVSFLGMEDSKSVANITIDKYFPKDHALSQHPIFGARFVEANHRSSKCW